MNKQQRRIFWTVFPLLCLMTVALSSFITYWRHTVPLSQCSEVYRRYRHLPNVRASFIKDKRINDTIAVDMTLFEANDSASYAALLYAMGNREEFIRDMGKLGKMPEGQESGENVSYAGDCLRGFPAVQGAEDITKNEVISYFPVRRCVAIFHTFKEDEYYAVLYKSYFGKINIEQ